MRSASRLRSSIFLNAHARTQTHAREKGAHVQRQATSCNSPANLHVRTRPIAAAPASFRTYPATCCCTRRRCLRRPPSLLLLLLLLLLVSLLLLRHPRPCRRATPPPRRVPTQARTYRSFQPSKRASVVMTSTQFVPRTLVSSSRPCLVLACRFPLGVSSRKAAKMAAAARAVEGAGHGGAWHGGGGGGGGGTLWAWAAGALTGSLATALSFVWQRAREATARTRTLSADAEPARRESSGGAEKRTEATAAASSGEAAASSCNATREAMSPSLFRGTRLAELKRGNAEISSSSHFVFPPLDKERRRGKVLRGASLNRVRGPLLLSS